MLECEWSDTVENSPSIFMSPSSSVYVIDHSTGYEHADTTSAVGLPRQQAPDRIHPQPCQPEGL